MDTKITELEIMIDKLNILFQSVKSDGELDKFEIELLKKYVLQMQEKLNAWQVVQPPTLKIEKTEIPAIIQVEPQQEINATEIIKIEEKPLEKEVVDQEIEKEIQIYNPPVVELKLDLNPPKQKEEKKLVEKLRDLSDDEKNKALNVKLSSNKKTLAERIQSSKAKDIISVIDLNDKLFFIKDLFSGDVDGYNSVLKKINTMLTFEEVKGYIKNDVSKQYDFSEEESVDRFLEVVKMKFE